MDLVIPLIQALGQMGGVGVFAAAMFILHRECLSAFRAELAAERKQSHEDHGKIMEAVNGNTTAIHAMTNGRK